MSDDDSTQLTRDIAPFGVRMPAGLKERVQAAAKANGRSTNAEIVATLEEKYPEKPFNMMEAYGYIAEKAEKLDGLADNERMRLFYEIQRKIAGPDFGIALSNGVLVLTATTGVDNMIEIRLPWLEGASIRSVETSPKDSDD